MRVTRACRVGAALHAPVQHARQAHVGAVFRPPRYLIDTVRADGPGADDLIVPLGGDHGALLTSGARGAGCAIRARLPLAASYRAVGARPRALGFCRTSRAHTPRGEIGREPAMPTFKSPDDVRLRYADQGWGAAYAAPRARLVRSSSSTPASRRHDPQLAERVLADSARTPPHVARAAMRSTILLGGVRAGWRRLRRPLLCICSASTRRAGTRPSRCARSCRGRVRQGGGLGPLGSARGSGPGQRDAAPPPRAALSAPLPHVPPPRPTLSTCGKRGNALNNVLATATFDPSTDGSRRVLAWMPC